jgi:hypothetical protein
MAVSKAVQRAERLVASMAAWMAEHWAVMMAAAWVVRRAVK